MLKKLLLLSFVSVPAGAILDIDSVTNKTKYEFHEEKYLRQSFSVETPEFSKLGLLGDSVLYKVLTEHLYSNSKNASDVHIQIEKYKTNKILSKKFMDLGLQHDLKKVWESALNSNVGEVYAATLEALIGAIYLDGGELTSKNFINHIFKLKLPPQLSAKRATSSNADALDYVTVAKKPKNRGEKLNPKALKSLHDILYLSHDEQVKRYGKKYLNHRYPEVDKHKGTYAIEVFKCYHGGVSALELHRVEASSRIEAENILASWALENLDKFEEEFFKKGIDRDNLVSGSYFLENIFTSLDYLRKRYPNFGSGKEYCRHVYKKVGENTTYAIEIFDRYNTHMKEIYRLQMKDETEAKKALADWTMKNLDQFIIDSKAHQCPQIFIDNGFVVKVE